MALEVIEKDGGLSLVPQWMSGDLGVPDHVAFANGIVFAVQTGEQTAQHSTNPKAVAGPRW